MERLTEEVVNAKCEDQCDQSCALMIVLDSIRRVDQLLVFYFRVIAENVRFVETDEFLDEADEEKAETNQKVARARIMPLLSSQIERIRKNQDEQRS